MKISANGITLHAEESGSGGLTLVFLHYWGGTARTWAPVIAALPAGLRSIALDARGWGQSDRPAGGYDITNQANDVEAAIAALDLKRYVLVGHSMGGKVAQVLASRRPSGLAGLILVAPSPAQGKALPREVREGMKGAYANAESVAWTIDNVLSKRALTTTLRDAVIADSVAGAEAAKQAWPNAAILEDVSADLARIEVPVLVIGGEKDDVDSVEMLRDLVVPSLPGARLEVIPGAGHLLPLEAPDDLAALIGGFLGTPRPEDIPGAFDRALNRGDLDAVMALFCPGATMRMTDGSVIGENDAALRSAIGGLIAAKPHLHNQTRRVLVSGDTALLLLDWKIQIGGDTGRGAATQIAQRGPDGNWRLRIANPLGFD